jgi:carbonic anhydrase
LVERVLTAEEQKQLTPDAIIASFKAGNERFINNDLTLRDHSAQVRQAALGQFPKAVVLSCLDSRIPVEEVLDRGIGDIFVARVAGNIVNEDILGSMEFGCSVAGAKVIMVLGHSHCGAVKSAIDNVKVGNITALLSNIRPAVDGMSNFDGEKSSKNKSYVDAVAQKNVHLTTQNIRNRSEILKGMETKGELKIIGAYYDLETGRISFLDN